MFLLKVEGNCSPSNGEECHDLCPLGEIVHHSDMNLFGYKEGVQVATISSLRE